MPFALKISKPYYGIRGNLGLKYQIDVEASFHFKLTTRSPLTLISINFKGINSIVYNKHTFEKHCIVTNQDHSKV